MGNLDHVGIPGPPPSAGVVLVTVACGSAITTPPPNTTALVGNFVQNTLHALTWLYGGSALGGIPVGLTTPGAGSYLTLSLDGFSGLNGSFNGSTGTGLSAVAPQVNAHNLGDWLICLFVADGGANITIPTVDAGTGDLTGIASWSGTAYSIVAAMRTITVTGQTGNETATLDVSANWVGVQFLITPTGTIQNINTSGAGL